MHKNNHIINLNSSVSDMFDVIRGAMQLKTGYAPHKMTEDEFLSWESENKDNYPIIKGYSSVLNEIQPKDTAKPIVIKKMGSRDSTAYLVFKDYLHFSNFQKGVLLLGTACYELHSGYIDNLLKKIADGYGLSDAEIDEGRNITERRIGLYFADNLNRTDDELSSAIKAFSKRILLNNVAQYMENISGKYLYIDENNIDIIDERQFFENTDCDVEQNRLIGCIVDKIYELKSKSDGRFDMKDCLLPQIISLKNATDAFLKTYYSNLNGRRTYWRPVTFGHQVIFSFDNGKKYLKNPIYIAECADLTIGVMIDDQSTFSQGEILSHISDIRHNVTQNGEIDLKLCSFAASIEQIGKALSKEIVTKEAIIAIAVGIAEVALYSEQSQR